MQQGYLHTVAFLKGFRNNKLLGEAIGKGLISPEIANKPKDVTFNNNSSELNDIALTPLLIAASNNAHLKAKIPELAEVEASIALAKSQQEAQHKMLLEEKKINNYSKLLLPSQITHSNNIDETSPVTSHGTMPAKINVTKSAANLVSTTITTPATTPATTPNTTPTMSRGVGIGIGGGGADSGMGGSYSSEDGNQSVDYDEITTDEEGTVYAENVGHSINKEMDKVKVNEQLSDDGVVRCMCGRRTSGTMNKTNITANKNKYKTSMRRNQYSNVTMSSIETDV